MVKVIIVNKKLAGFVLASLTRSTKVYYLSSDYQGYDLFCRRYPKLTFKRLDDLFHSIFNRIKGDLRLMIADLGAKYNNPVWWGSQQASLNTASTPLAKDITYFFCAQQIVSAGEDIVFILEGDTLAKLIYNFVRSRGNSCRYFGGSFIGGYMFLLRWLRHFAQIGHFLTQMVLTMLARHIVPKLPKFKQAQVKRVVLRSWLTDGVFDKEGKFKDRNFGMLSSWLKNKGYEVWILPMFFNFSMSFRKFCGIVKRQEQQFIISWDYLNIRDYWDVLRQSLMLTRLRIGHVFIESQDVTALVKESLWKDGFCYSLSILNLSLPLMKRLQSQGYEIDAFYYPYEGNAPEKNFLVGCRRYYPQALLVGFQHTVFFPEQLAFYLAPGEDRQHPLPDKIVCSGAVYENLYKGAGIPERLLVAGPNLRFSAVYESAPVPRYLDSGKTHNFLIPTTFSYDQDFELLVKVVGAIRNLSEYRVWIRKHPVMSRQKLVAFLDRIGLNNFELADSGLLQDWLPNMHAVFSSGSSVTILEAVARGVPVIRVVPENVFFYDPLIWPEYPLAPAISEQEILKNIGYIDNVRYNNERIFSDIAAKVRVQYFTQPSEENLKVFL